jgi:hypothetical protein
MDEDENTPPDTPFGIRSAVLQLHATIQQLVARVTRLEAIERRMNYPALVLLAGNLATLLYIARHIH